MEIINLLALDLKNLQEKETTKPRMVPMPKEMTISNNGFTNEVKTLKEEAPTTVLATENKIANKIKAAASSKATTGNKVLTKGPLALYCLTTIKVAAGAVAAAIAPRVITNSQPI